MRRAALTFGCGAFLLAGAGVANATVYDVAFATPDNTHLDSIDGINNANQLVGSGQVVLGSTIQGFVWSPGTRSVTFLPPAPGYDEPTPSGINDHGQIVGDAWKPGYPFGFLLSGGAYHFFIKGDWTALSGINNAGTVVGIYQPGGIGLTVSFVKTKTADGAMQTVNYPGAFVTYAKAINNSGDRVVGTYIGRDDQEHGFLLHNGVYTTVDYPGAAETTVTGVNNDGVIVGNYYDVAGSMLQYGFADDDGSFTSSGAFAARDRITFSGINDARVIAGYDFGTATADGSYVYPDIRAFIATPKTSVAVDEPAPLAPLAGGLGLLALLLRGSTARRSAASASP